MNNRLYKDCRRYGKIHSITDTQHNEGVLTVVSIVYQDLFYTFELLRGEVLDVEIKPLN